MAGPFPPLAMLQTTPLPAMPQTTPRPAMVQTTPLPAMPQPANASPAAIAKAARDFEAMTIAQFLEPMFDTVQTAKGLFGGGAGEEAWKPMLVQQIAKEIAAHGGLGLAKPIEEAMRRAQGGRDASVKGVSSAVLPGVRGATPR